MYCPRCKIETGTETFCENCGGATVASDEVAAVTEEQTETINPIKEKNKTKSTNKKVTKKSIKRYVTITCVAIMVITGLGMYRTLQSQYTPKNEVTKFYNYVVKKDYDNAFKQMVDTDDRFMDKEDFKVAIGEKNINTFYIKSYNQADFPQSYNTDISQGSNVKNISSNMFTVQGSGKLYAIGVNDNGSNLIFFKDYKINADSFAINWQISAPTGAKVLVNGKAPDISNQPNDDSAMPINGTYKPSSVLYQIDKIFDGSYDVTAKMDGAKDFKIVKAPAGKKVTINFNPNDSTIKQLQSQSKAYLDLYYSNATQDKYSKILTTDSDVLSKMSLSGFGTTSVTNKLKDLTVVKSQLDDADHATMSVKGSVSYEDSSMVQFGGAKTTGTKDMTLDLYFERVDGKWLISDSGYIS